MRRWNGLSRWMNSILRKNRLNADWLSLALSESEGDKTLTMQWLLIEPYIQNSDEDEIQKEFATDMTDMDKDEMERMFMKMLSTMMKKVPSHKTTDGSL